jgi:hypothetical protein
MPKRLRRRSSASGEVIACFDLVLEGVNLEGCRRAIGSTSSLSSMKVTSYPNFVCLYVDVDLVP